LGFLGTRDLRVRSLDLAERFLDLASVDRAARAGSWCLLAGLFTCDLQPVTTQNDHGPGYGLRPATCGLSFEPTGAAS